MNWLRRRIRRSRKAALVVGKSVFLAGALLILVAVFGRASLINLNADRAEQQLPPLSNLAQAFPHLPTFLAPETALGFAVAAVLVLVGMVLASLASE